MTMTIPPWQWDETVQRGTDYESLAEVEVYDRRMAALRDVAAEAEKILSLLDLGPDGILLEVGTGTGAFARKAAGHCRRVIALDISPVMLTYAATRAREEQVDNLEFHQAGFLTYEHQGEPLAAVVSQLSLHHLPDPWKLIALRRLSRFLGEGGRLYLSDVVLPDSAQGDWAGHFQTMIDSLPEDWRAEMSCHFRDEYSTFDWMMREILARAGFVLESAETEGAFLTHYLCRKP
jgi:ubiquinone/menaquinone biosynthesis C-methylase UbiE